MAAKLRLILGRPRFVAALAAGALAACAYEVVSLSTMSAPTCERQLLGYRVVGAVACSIAVIKLAVYVVGGVGLWRMRSWARLVAMIYLAYELVSYVVVGAGGLAELVGVQLLLIPYATFCFMYLQRNAKAFN